MGNKISANESMDSISALMEYKRNFSASQKMRVVAERDHEIIFNNRVMVVIGDYNIYQRVDIMWDDVEPDYHDIGLYGYYSTDYCHMDYDDGVLTIFDGNGTEITITE